MNINILKINQLYIVYSSYIFESNPKTECNIWLQDCRITWRLEKWDTGMWIAVRQGTASSVKEVLVPDDNDSNLNQKCQITNLLPPIFTPVLVLFGIPRCFPSLGMTSSCHPSTNTISDEDSPNSESTKGPDVSLKSCVFAGFSSFFLRIWLSDTVHLLYTRVFGFFLDRPLLPFSHTCPVFSIFFKETLTPSWDRPLFQLISLWKSPCWHICHFEMLYYPCDIVVFGYFSYIQPKKLEQLYVFLTGFW